ncbi:MAG TPA: ATP-binding cassette domain-containing protein [Solirubrobacteraceae bacterium]|jgi:ABC-2 type transport system ATP-binding protein|nr:ATP-binding cassette domain-containing protein [Solirubrobacteraceae bacterium]
MTSEGTRPAILAEGLVKRFGKTLALDGLDLEVAAGTVFGLLGPNGAGKTTAVRIFTTLLEPDAGRAEVAGLDCVRDADRLRSQIGLAGQYAAVDELLTGRENLEMVGRLYRMSRAQSRARARELLEQFGLSGAGERIAKTYSGGMRRRLDLAAALIATPPVLFLDEPTTGLDPRSRLAMWERIGALRAQGVTLLLTTQYLEEADFLADLIAVIDHGRMIAVGTADQLKSQVGGERIELTLGRESDLSLGASTLERHLDGPVRVEEDARRLSGPAAAGARRLTDVVRDFDAAGLGIDDLAVRRPTLDDVFLTLTGHVAEEDEGEQEEAA